MDRSPPGKRLENDAHESEGIFHIPKPADLVRIDRLNTAMPNTKAFSRRLNDNFGLEIVTARLKLETPQEIRSIGAKSGLGIVNFPAAKDGNDQAGTLIG